MFKRVIITTVVCILSGGLFGAYFFFVHRLVKEHSAQETFRSLDILVVDSLENSLIGSSEVQKRLAQWRLEGPCDSINLNSLESAVSEFGEVAHAEAYRTGNGHITIELSQRTPVVRLFSRGGTYYSDDRGFLFPVYRYTDVPMVTGEIPIATDTCITALSPEQRKWLEGIISLSEYISANDYWKNAIEQIDISSQGDIILYAKGIQQSIIFGRADDIEAKFDKLEAFCRNILPNAESKKYSTVNLKYDNQIICK